jgi:NAD(P)H-hydrate epimerase
MKLLTASQIKEADAYTITREPIASIDLMERAATAFIDAFMQIVNVYQLKVAIVAGTGNNGGDGLAIARLLHQFGAKPSVFIVGDPNKTTPDFNINLERLSLTDIPVIWVGNLADFNRIAENAVIVDALFGTGLTRPATGKQKEVIEFINHTQKMVVSVDIPSGLFCDMPPSENDAVVSATHTITFQQPKLSFLLPESGRFCGKVHVVDIGLSKEFYEAAEVEYFLTEKREIASQKIFQRQKFSHKGNYGHLLLVAGSLGKAGAAVLSAKAAIKSGVGLLTVLCPQSNVPILQSSVHEAMCIADTECDFISNITNDFASAIAIGPGMGTHEKTSAALMDFLSRNSGTMVLDADALNLLAQQKSYKLIFSKQCVITPHPKEFDRLAGKSVNSFERLEKAKWYSKTHGVVVVLKGAHTAIIHPCGKTYFNTTGNAGMATGGSGDVLTGIIGAFLAQGLSAWDAAITGVYLHGLAGDLAAAQKTQMCLTASDIIECLPEAVKAVAADSSFI